MVCRSKSPLHSAVKKIQITAARARAQREHSLQTDPKKLGPRREQTTAMSIARQLCQTDPSTDNIADAPSPSMTLTYLSSHKCCTRTTEIWLKRRILPSGRAVPIHRTVEDKRRRFSPAFYLVTTLPHSIMQYKHRQIEKHPE